MIFLKNAFCALCILCFSSILTAQIKLPSVDAQSLFAFESNNMSLYSGGCGVSVPLYTIESFVNVPISISYSGGHGIKVREHASRVGLGWSLNATQCISKVIKGVHDSGPNGFHQYSNTNYGDGGYIDWNSSPSSNEIYQLDYEPDLNYYSTLNRSGTFYRDKNDNFIQIPLSNTKIQGKFEEKSGEFIITETNGVKYIFSEVELTKNEIILPGYGNADYLSSSCYLKKIISADESNEIQFFYKDGLERVYNYDNSGEPMVVVPNTEILGYPKSYSETKTKVLDYISWSGGSLNFIYNDNRKDLIGGLYLQSLILKDLDGKKIKTFKFDYSYFGNNRTYALDQVENIPIEDENRGSELRLKLDAVYSMDTEEQKVSTYRMEYNINEWLPERSSYSIDHWGYYNGADNINLCPHANLNPDGSTSSMQVANRSANSFFALAGSLNKIIYPTGGHSEFIYEGNSVPGSSLDSKVQNLFSEIVLMTESTHEKLIGDVLDYNYLYGDRSATLDCSKITRDKKIEIRLDDYPITDNAVFVTFKNLDTSETETITINENKRSYYLNKAGKYKVTARSNQQNLTQRWDLSFSWNSLISSIDPESNFTVGGLRIAEIRNSDGDAKVQIKRYNYQDGDKSTGYLVESPQYLYVKDNRLPVNTYSNLFYANNPIFPLKLTKGSVVGYSKVTEYEIGNGKQEYYFSTAYNCPDVLNSSFKTPPYSNSAIISGYGEVPYFPLAEKQSNEMFRGLLLSNKIFKELAPGNYKLQREIDYYYDLYKLDNLRYVPNEHLVKINNDAMFPDAVKSIKGQKIKNIKDIIYGIEYFLHSGATFKQRSVQTDYYEGKNIVLENEYLYNSTGQLIIDKQQCSDGTLQKEYQYPGKAHLLYGLNILDTPIKVKQKKNSLLVNENVTEYAIFNGNNKCVLPSKVKEAVINKDHKVISYDDVVEYSKYKQEGKPIVIKDKSGIQTVYVWGKNENYPIAKITNANYAQVYSNTNLLNNIKELDNIKGLELDSERLKLKNLNHIIRSQLTSSFVETFTYLPLIGLESKTDPNELTSYYKYDSFGRLERVTNSDNELVKSYSYNYGKTIEPILSLSIDNLNFSSNLSTKQLVISSNQNWKVTSNESWLISDKTISSNNGTVGITCLANSGAERNAVLTVEAGGMVKYVSVKQEAGISLSVTPSSISVPAMSLDPKYIDINSTAGWSISSNVSWISFDKNSGVGNGRVSVYFVQNDSLDARNAMITVSSGQVSRVINITQDGSVDFGGPGKK
ncbi:hypothetical protein DF185_00010 [Marinifilum breve]|uniref:BACON domain-containing protein n=1 Tax=Marinifilum breve TaxID=2184082 RepID=A0A2V4A2D7_9BACT|nr:BACON domain-containing protein [Marinifilum breve]PXY02513.1 hypothetical protein DF185_00010 [Marinifilum breve]